MPKIQEPFTSYKIAKNTFKKYVGRVPKQCVNGLRYSPIFSRLVPLVANGIFCGIVDSITA